LLQPALRIVLDTNTLLRGLVAANSAAARVRRAAEARTFITLLSKPVMVVAEAGKDEDGSGYVIPKL
jgi:predicted nucleic acid-binding protein